MNRKSVGFVHSINVTSLFSRAFVPRALFIVLFWLVFTQGATTGGFEGQALFL